MIVLMEFLGWLNTDCQNGWRRYLAAEATGKKKIRSILRQLDALKDVYYAVIDQFGHYDVEVKRDKHLAWAVKDEND